MAKEVVRSHRVCLGGTLYLSPAGPGARVTGWHDIKTGPKGLLNRIRVMPMRHGCG